MIDFPNTPVDGQIFTVGDTSWQYSSSIGAWLTYPYDLTLNNDLQVINDLQVDGNGQVAGHLNAGTFFSSNDSTPTFATASNYMYAGGGKFSLGEKLVFDAATPGSGGFGMLTVVGRIRGAIENYEVVSLDRGSRTIVQASVSNGLVTVTTASAHGFAVGDTVVIDGVTGDFSYLVGAWRILGNPSSTTFTFAVDDPSLDYVSLDGADDYISTPDSAALDILGTVGTSRLFCPGPIGNYAYTTTGIAPAFTDGELAIRVSLQQIGVVQYLMGWESTYGWLSLDASNNLYIMYRRTGDAASIGLAASSVPVPGLAVNTKIWLRGKMTASSATCEYWYSLSDTNDYSDVSWTSIGTPVVGSNAGSTVEVSPSSTNIIIGSVSSGTAGFVGDVYACAELVNGSIRTKVDFTGQAIGTSSFIDGASKTVTVMGSAAKIVDGTTFLFTNGTNGNYASSPDAAATRITGDLELVWRGSMADWDASGTLIGKWQFTGIYLARTVSGTIQYFDGGAYAAGAFSAAHGLVDGTTYWIKVTHNTTTGLVSFYKANDQETEPTSWTLISSTGATAGARPGTAGDQVEIGAYGAGAVLPANGRHHRAIIRSGIGGTKVFDADFTRQIQFATTFTEAHGAVVTVNGTGARIERNRDIEIVWRGTLTDWANGAVQVLCAKYGGGGGSWLFASHSSGELLIQHGADGSGSTVVASNALPSLTDGVAYWLKMTRSGAGSVRFYKAADQETEPTLWTEVGTAQASYNGGLYPGTEPVRLGSYNSGYFATGSMKRCIIRNGIDGSIVADWAAYDHPSNSSPYIDRAGNTWTINGGATVTKPTITTSTAAVSGASPSARVRELTIGLHPEITNPEGTVVSPAGLGMRLDEYNYWFLNNQFRVGSASRYYRWNGSTLEIVGKVTADEGQIGGWLIGSTTLTGGNVTLSSSGTITAGSGSNTAGMTGSDSNFRFWAGFSTPSGAPFRITSAGVLVSSGAVIQGSINAADLTLTGNITITTGGINILNSYLKAGNLRVGPDVNGTDDGIWITADNYWYDTGAFKVGGPTQNVTWTSPNLTVTGTINATAGNITGALTVASGTMKFGQDVSGTNDGLYITANDYWYSSGRFAVASPNGIWYAGSGNVQIGTGVTVSGPISGSTIDIGGADATSFHVDISGNLWAGAATYDLNTNPFAVANDGSLRARQGFVGGWAIATASLTSNTGNITLSNDGNITAGTSNNVVRISGSDATYRLWAGNSVAASAPFSVTQSGALTATLGSIAGWTISPTAIHNGATVGIGSGATPFWAGGATPNNGPKFQVTSNGSLRATNVDISGKINAVSGTFAGSLSAATGTFAGALSAATGTFAGSLTAATGSFSGSITANSGTIAGWTITSTTIHNNQTIGIGTGATPFWAGGATPSNPAFSVTSTGALRATNANISGNINAVSGTFAGSLSAATGTFAGALSAATGTFAGTLSAASGSFSGNVTASAGSIAGWTLSPSAIHNATGTTGMGSGATPFWAGGATPNAKFAVHQSGNLYATAAYISGTIQSSAGVIGGFTINPTYLYSGASPSFVMMSTGTNTGGFAFAAGDNTYTKAPFRVTNTGSIYSRSFSLLSMFDSQNSTPTMYLGSVSAGASVAGSVNISTKETTASTSTGSISGSINLVNSATPGTDSAFAGGVTAAVYEGLYIPYQAALKTPTWGSSVVGAGIFWSDRNNVFASGEARPVLKIQGPSYYSDPTYQPSIIFETTNKGAYNTGGTGIIGISSNYTYISGSGLFLTGGGDVNKTSTSGRLILGDTSSTSMGIDENEIQVRSASSSNVPNLMLQANGGSIRLGKWDGTGGYVDLNMQVQAYASDSAATPSYSWGNDSNTGMYRSTANRIGFSIAGTERLRLGGAGVGLVEGDGLAIIGTYTGSHMAFDGNTIQVKSNGTTAATLGINTSGGDVNVGPSGGSTGTLTLRHGTTSISGDLTMSGTAKQILARDGSASVPAYTFNSDTDTGMYYVSAGVMAFTTAGTQVLRLDGNFTVFGSTNDTNPTDNTGTTNVAVVSAASAFNNAVDGGACAQFNRLSSDGNIVNFYQAGTNEGSISVSGTTITYGAFCGVHWSQHEDENVSDMPRGTILSTVNELAEWKAVEFETVEGYSKHVLYDGPENAGTVVQYEYTDGVTYSAVVVLEINEHLPKVKISDVISDKAVYGVFNAIDEDGDINVASLGAHVIRIQNGETVMIGDLLESAGNGCARVQADDIIRSSTVGKVTSSIVAETFNDGSYLVPAVLYCG